MITRIVLEGEDSSFHARVSPTQARSLEESAREEPRLGVYLVARTWRQGYVLDLDAHFDRLEQSARAMGKAVQVPRRMIRQIIATNLPRRDGRIRDGRFRVTAVLEGTLRFIISLEEAKPLPERVLREGVTCQVLQGAARHDAEVKSTAWMHERRLLPRGEFPADQTPPYEFLLTDEAGYILEGATSNFYAVLAGELWTAREGVLQGTARRIVLEVTPRIVPVRLQPLPLARLGEVEEAFITSATRGVVPVRRIGTMELDAVGPVTREIATAYERWLEAHLEPLLSV